MAVDEGQTEELRMAKLQARTAALRLLEAAEENGNAVRIAEARQAVRRIQLEIARNRLDD